MWKPFRDWYFDEEVSDDVALAYLAVMAVGYTAVVATYIPRQYMLTGAAFSATLIVEQVCLLSGRLHTRCRLGIPLTILGIYVGVMHALYGIPFFCVRSCGQIPAL